MNLQIKSFKLKSFTLKLRVANQELNLELQFSKIFAQSNLETAGC